MRRSKQNQLYPDFLDYISNPKVRALIIMYELEKYGHRATAEKGAVNWRLLPHKLNALDPIAFSRVKGVFLGGWDLKHCRAMYPEVENYHQDYHSLNVPILTPDYCSGLFQREGSQTIKKGNGVTAIEAPISLPQNHRQFHLQKAAHNYFNNRGSLRVSKKALNTSRFSWGCNSLSENQNQTQPALEKMMLQGKKGREQSCYVEGQHGWGKGGKANLDILAGYKYRVRQAQDYPKDPQVSMDFRAGHTDGDGGITLSRSSRVLQYTQNDYHVLERQQSFFNSAGKLRKKGAKSAEQELFFKDERDRKIAFDFLDKAPIKRTDLHFKTEVLKYTSPAYNNYIRKLPEYMPGMALQLHAFKSLGYVLPDEQLERQEEYYPLELGTYYMDVYQNIFNKLGIPMSDIVDPMSGRWIKSSLFFFSLAYAVQTCIHYNIGYKSILSYSLAEGFSEQNGYISGKGQPTSLVGPSSLVMGPWY